MNDDQALWESTGGRVGEEPKKLFGTDGRTLPHPFFLLC